MWGCGSGCGVFSGSAGCVRFLFFWIVLDEWMDGYWGEIRTFEVGCVGGGLGWVLLSFYFSGEGWFDFFFFFSFFPVLFEPLEGPFATHAAALFPSPDWKSVVLSSRPRALTSSAALAAASLGFYTSCVICFVWMDCFSGSSSTSSSLLRMRFLCVETSM